MGRNPPTPRRNLKRVGGTKKESVEQKKSPWNKKRVGGTKGVSGTKQESVGQK